MATFDPGPDPGIVFGDLARQHLMSAFHARLDQTHAHPRSHARCVDETRRTARPSRLVKQLVNCRHPAVSERISLDDGARLAVDVKCSVGAPNGTIVFVHGFCGNKGENGLFDALASHAAASGFDTVSYDWRGIGDSDGSFETTSLDDHVEDFHQVAAWVRARFDKATPVYGVGFSLGAAVIGRALEERAELDSVAYLSPAVRPSMSMWPRYNTDVIRRELDRHGVVKKPGSSVMLGRAILESLRDTDLGEKAFEIDVPLLVCHGTADTRIDCSHTQELVARRGAAPDFAYLQLDGASHSFRPEAQSWRLLAAALTSWFHGERRSARSRI